MPNERKGSDPSGSGSGCRYRIGKRGTLKEDSSLGLKGIDMSEVDLSRLMGGKSFTIHCTLSRNGYGVKTTALADSGANAFTLLNAKCAQKISKFLNTPFEQLERPIPVKGYNGQAGKPITSILRIHLRVDGRRQYNVPFLVTDLGHHNVILRRKWLAYFNL